MKDERRGGAGRPRDWRGLRIAAELSAVGLTLALSVGIGIALGVWLDQRFKSGGMLVIIFTLLGVVAGFQQLIRTVIRAGREQDNIEREQREERERTPDPDPIDRGLE